MKKKKLQVLEVEGSNGILASLQFSKTTIHSVRGIKHDEHSICLLLECECNGGRNTRGIPLIMNSEQACALRLQLGQMIDALEIAKERQTTPIIDDLTAEF